MVFGGHNLVYHLGSPVSYYGDPMQVLVDFGKMNLASPAASFDEVANSIIVD